TTTVTTPGSTTTITTPGSTTTVTTPGATTTVTTPGATTTVTTPGATTTVTPTAPRTPAVAKQDVTPPNTRIVAGPARATAGRHVVFRFVATERRSTFECRLDRGRWLACRSPKAYAALSPG